MSHIKPQWPAPKNIHAFTTLRYPGDSHGKYAEFNLAAHVGDDLACVKANRLHLLQKNHLPSEPKWLDQTHSTIALLAEKIHLKHSHDNKSNNHGDASYTKKAGVVCVVMTADCLPILITNKTGTEVSAIHAGWKGLAAGVVESTFTELSSKPESLIAWIGPSILKNNYEVGEDLYQAFEKDHTPKELKEAFEPYNIKSSNNNNPKKWLADIPLLATQRLIKLGMNPEDIYLSNECTFANPDRYFSFRRDDVTGRMASLIWMD